MCMSTAPQLPERPPYSPRKTIVEATEWWVLVEGREPEDVARSLEARADLIREKAEYMREQQEQINSG